VVKRFEGCKSFPHVFNFFRRSFFSRLMEGTPESFARPGLSARAEPGERCFRQINVQPGAETDQPEPLASFHLIPFFTQQTIPAISPAIWTTSNEPLLRFHQQAFCSLETEA